MTKEHKTHILHFITRTGMYISPEDDRNVVSFIHGYEYGTQYACDFTKLLTNLLTEKYRIDYRSDGWPGQISRLAQKLALSWVVAFKRIAIEIVADDQNSDLDIEMMEVLKTRIQALIERINPNGDFYFNKGWTEEWISLCAVNSQWFKQLWTDNEWTIIQSIDVHIKANNVFRNTSDRIPTPELIELKELYDRQKNR